MRSLPLLALALLAQACAKSNAPVASATVSKNSAEVLAAFDDTKAQSGPRLLSVASSALRAGLSLDSARAERCWREETDRPALRETCVLLWAGRGADSAVLESVLVEGRSRLLALGLLQRPSLLSRVPFAGLLELADILAADPLWVRAELAKAWLESHPRPEIREGEALLPKLRPQPDAGPRDLSSTLGAIRQLRAGAWLEELTAYCDPATKSEARLRCWRVVGAIASPSTAAELRPFLGNPVEDDWTLFSRAFPRLAVKIQANLR